METRMKEMSEDLNTDNFVKVTGKLKLNESDIGFMNFILQDARFVR